MTMKDPGARPPRGLLAALLLVCALLMTVDAKGGDPSPVEPLRTAAGVVAGPVEDGATFVASPVFGLVHGISTNHHLREEVAALSAQNSRLRSSLARQPLDRHRVAELDGLIQTSERTGYHLVATRVIAMGPMQSFTRTVTIDAGTSSGIHPDMTVLNNDGLVGRVVRATPSSATVLLLVDRGSVVGGRLGSNMEIGSLRGRGDLGDNALLDLGLVNDSVTPRPGDVVVTWGSQGGRPYVAGIPIGTVEQVHATPRQMTARAVVRPFVDFTALDVVGVVVPARTHADRAVITPKTQKVLR